MNRVACVLVAALVFACSFMERPVRAAYVQAWTGTAGDPSAGLTNTGINTTTGNTICVGTLSASFDTIADGDVTDNKSNTFTRVSTIFTPSGITMAMFYAVNITGGASHTITFTRADTSYGEITAVELGSMEASAFDASASNTNQTGTPLDTTAATTTATDTLCAVFATNEDTGTWTAGSGYTIRSEGAHSMLQTQDSVASGTPNATATKVGQTGWAASVAAFKEAGGGGPTCRGALLLLGVGGC